MWSLVGPRPYKSAASSGRRGGGGGGVRRKKDLPEGGGRGWGREKTSGWKNFNFFLGIARPELAAVVSGPGSSTWQEPSD